MAMTIFGYRYRVLVMLLNGLMDKILIKGEIND